MYELYCSSGGSSGSGLDDVSCSQLPHYCGPLELREVPGEQHAACDAMCDGLCHAVRWDVTWLAGV